MLRYCLLLLPVLLAACGNDTGSTSAAAGDSTSTDVSVGNFYKRFSGTIAGKPVVVQLHSWGGVIQGSYQYSSVGQVIQLRSSESDTMTDNQYILFEISPGEITEGNSVGAEWSLTIEGSRATGEWRISDGVKHYPISLTEDYPAGSTKLDAFYIADSAALLPDQPTTPKAISTYSYLLPPGGTKGFLYNALRSQIVPGSSTGDDIATAIKAENTSYFEDYRTENAPLLQAQGTDENAFTFSYTNNVTVIVLYNDDNWLVTESFSSSYTGGAHGNYSSSYANIDLQQQRVWRVSDIITDTTAIRPILNDAAIAYFKLKPDEGMDQRLLVDEVPPTGNVYLSSTGLTFVYNPYEIASYAEGQVFLFLSYKKLMPFLTPAFKTRMRLSERGGVTMLITCLESTLS